jgi:hypothetical protein
MLDFLALIPDTIPVDSSLHPTLNVLYRPFSDEIPIPIKCFGILGGDGARTRDLCRDSTRPRHEKGAG